MPTRTLIVTAEDGSTQRYKVTHVAPTALADRFEVHVAEGTGAVLRVGSYPARMVGKRTVSGSFAVIGGRYEDGEIYYRGIFHLGE